MKESVLRDLLAGSLPKLVAGGLKGIYTDAFDARPFKADGSFSIQSPLALSQLAMSPKAQVLSFLVMEADSMLRAGRRLFPGMPREEALRMVVSANAEVLNFTGSRLAWLLAKVEGIPGAEITPPKVGNFTGAQACRVRGEEGIFLDFLCPAQNVSFRFVTSVQCL